jgi:translation initiation factor 2 subunit 3
MTKEEDLSSLPSINVGIVGHIDHGKTTLLYKLTGKWTDTHSEELKRGITIKLGYADCIIRDKDGIYNVKEGKPIRYVSFIDAPGHEMLMATMLSGAAIIDAAVLVIAANEGIKPQTREHLMALQARGLTNIIIVQNKIDLVSREEAIKSYQAIKEFTKGTVAENAPIIPCSAQQEVNIDKILEAISNVEIPKRNLEEKPFFVVARSFDVNKPGSKIENLKGGVLGGALKCGVLREGDEIEIKPGLNIKKENQIIYQPIKTKVLALFRGSQKIKEATPGSSLAIETSLDPNLSKADNLSGCVVGLAGQLPEITYKAKLKYHLFNEILGVQGNIKVENIRSPELLLLSVNTSITVGQVTRAHNDEADMVLRIPIVPFKTDKIGIARNLEGHWRLIGWGELIQ